MPKPLTITLNVWESPEAVATAAARLFADTAAAAVQARGQARIAISGGTTPKRMFQVLAAEPLASSVPWQQVHLYWVDERAVGPNDPESNYRMTAENLLSRVPLPAENIHRMEGELPPEEAADRYETVLRNSMRLEGAESPAFDLLLLGMGDDGHTASLFPHTAGLDEITRLVIANHVPQKDTWRITLTAPVINQARTVAFLIEGAAKAKVLAEVLTGPRDVARLPSQLIRPATGQLSFYLDAAAAADLPKSTETLTGPEGSHTVSTLER